MKKAQSTNSIPKEEKTPWLFVTLMGMIFSLAPLAIDMYLPALPSMAESFSVPIARVEATVAIFLLGYAIAQLILGPLSDVFGRTKILLTGLGVFFLASFLIPLSPNLFVLYILRLFQALGGGASVVVFAMVQDRFDVKKSAQIISYIMAVVVVAPMVAPIIGGEILVATSWNWIFWALAAYGLFAFLLTWKKLSGSNQKTSEEKTGKLNLRELADGYREVFSKGVPLAHILAGAFAFAGLFAFVAGSPFVYIEYFGVSPDTYGYLVGLNALAMITANLTNASILKNIDPTNKVIFGGIIMGFAGAYLFAAAYFTMDLPYIVAGVVVFVGMIGLIAANAIAGALSHFPNNGGMVSGVSGVAQFGIGALSSGLVSLSHSESAIAMNSVMAFAALLTFICALYLSFKKRTTTNSTNNATNLSENLV